LAGTARSRTEARATARGTLRSVAHEIAVPPLGPIHPPGARSVADRNQDRPPYMGERGRPWQGMPILGSSARIPGVAVCGKIASASQSLG
jgi:hypothetical protein